MLKNRTMPNTIELAIHRLKYGLSAIALTLAVAGSMSLPAGAQSRSTISTSGEFKVAAHTIVHSVLQPNYKPPRKKRRRYARRRVKKPAATPAWFPKDDTKDPVQIVVSLPEQKLTVYRGDKAVVTSRVSSGKAGYSTPSGVFSILQKNRTHFSNIYRGAPMPYMQRLTWSGIAFHGSSSVPKDRPASHGCVRLPHAFASQLFRYTEKGGHVIVANEKSVAPVEITHDKLFQPISRMSSIPSVNASVPAGEPGTPVIMASAPVTDTTAPAEDVDAIESELAAAQSDTEVTPPQVSAEVAVEQSGTQNMVEKSDAVTATVQSDDKVAVANSKNAVMAAMNDAKAKEKKRSTSPIRVLVTRRTGREVMIEVQKMLSELSFGAGDADGYMGPDTAQAIRRFQATYGLKKDGLVSDELIAMLYKVSEKGAPTNGHLYVRRDFNPVFDAPVVIKGGNQPLGSHLYTAMYFDEGASETRWLAVTLKKGSGNNAAYGRSAGKKKKKGEDIVLAEAVPEPATATQALDRIEIPEDIRKRINKMLTPGSSLAITNDGISRETTPKGTDFIVLMQ